MTARAVGTRHARHRAASRRAEAEAALGRLLRFETKYDRRIGIAVLAVVAMVVFSVMR